MAGLSVRALLVSVAVAALTTSALGQQPAGAPVALTAPTVPEVKPAGDLSPLKPAELGIARDTQLPPECGGEVLPSDWTKRAAALTVCKEDLDNRHKVAEALEKLRKSRSTGNTGGVDLPDPASSVANLTAKPGYDQLKVRDEGNKGTSVDDGRRRQADAPAGAGQLGVPDISSLSELTLVGGGCADICVAVFKAGGKTISVQRVGEPVAVNAQVTSISGKDGNFSVKVTLRRPGLADSSKEFRL